MSNKKQKGRPVNGLEIKLGDIFSDLPDDLDKALADVTTKIQHVDSWSITQARGLANVVYRAVLARLLNEELNDMRGPKGPRLPKGTTIIDLLAHLVEARRAQQSAISFNAWVREHEWPGGMHVPVGTARNWLLRYEKQISHYERFALPKNTHPN
jgi:hypothetical protein